MRAASFRKEKCPRISRYAGGMILIYGSNPYTAAIAIFLQAARREHRHCQTGGAERQFVHVVPAAIAIRVCRIVDCCAQDRAVVRQPDLRPRAAPRRHELFEARRGAWEVIRDYVDELARGPC